MKIKFKNTALYAMFTLIALTVSFRASYAQTKVLLFTRTAAYHHASIAAGTTAIIKLGKANGFGVDVTADSTKIVESNLKKYAAVIFLSTTGNILSPYQ